MGNDYAYTILDKGKELGVYSDSIDNRNSQFQNAALKIVNSFKKHLKETFGKPIIKTKGYGAGQKYVTIHTGDDNCTVDINYWATTYKTIGKKSRTLPYTLNIGIEGECVGVQDKLRQIIEDTLKSMKSN